MINKETHYKTFLLKTGYAATIIILILLFIKYLLNPLLPFLIALAVSMALQPLIKRLTERFHIRKNIISIVTVLLVYLLLTALAAGILIGFISALIRWAGGLPGYFTDFVYPWVERAGNQIVAAFVALNPKYADTVDNMLPDLVRTISDFVVSFSGNIVAGASSLGTRLPSAFLTAIICVVATVFLASDYENVAGKLFQVFNEKTQKAMLFGRSAFVGILKNYIKSYSLIFLITFSEMAIGLLIIGYENALLYAFGVAVFDILPVVGSGMVLVPWIIITFIQGLIGRGIGLSILWFVIVTARQILEPKIVGKQIGMHPLATLVCMWVGLKLAGGAGLFLFPLSLLVAKELKEAGMIGDVPAAVTQEAFESDKTV